MPVPGLSHPPSSDALSVVTARCSTPHQRRKIQRTGGRLRFVYRRIDNFTVSYSAVFHIHYLIHFKFKQSSVKPPGLEKNLTPPRYTEEPLFALNNIFSNIICTEFCETKLLLFLNTETRIKLEDLLRSTAFILILFRFESKLVFNFLKKKQKKLCLKTV